MNGSLPRGASVVLQVARVRRGRLVVRLVHAGLFAAGGGAALLGAALSAGHVPGDPRVIALVAVGAAAAAAIYLGDTARGADHLTRELDRKLARGGALLTAWQAERREPDAPFTRLLAEREAAALRGSEALRCCTPHWALAVVLPLLLCAWCASVAAREAPAPIGVTPQQRVERAARALEGAAQAARERAAAPAAQAEPGALRAQRAAELQRLATQANDVRADATGDDRAGAQEAGIEALRNAVVDQLARGGWSAAERLELERALDALEGLRRDAGDGTLGELRDADGSSDPGVDEALPPGDGAGREALSDAVGDAQTSRPAQVAGAGPAGPAESPAAGAGGGETSGVATVGGASGASSGALGDGPLGAPDEPGASEALGDGSVQRPRRRVRGAEARLLEAWARRLAEVPPGSF